MRAALILRLARARRCAIVGSATRNDRATSLVDRPPSSRNVSATWASMESAGWQQVKMRRSRSSCTGPSFSGPPGSSLPGKSTAASLSSSRPRDSRRRRSMARLRAVVVIQPPGLGGSPSPGHLRSATANASCTASSARSMSPKTRIRAATDRPDSSRKMRPTSASSTLGGASTSCTLSARGCLPEGPDLDRPLHAVGGLRRPRERRVEVLGLDDVEAAEVFLRLREGAVGGQHLAVGHAHDGGGVGFVQAAGEDPGASRLDLLLEHADPPHELPHLLLAHWLAGLALDGVHGQQVLRHGDPPHDGQALPASHPNYERASPRMTRVERRDVESAYASSDASPHRSNSHGSGKPRIPTIRSPSTCSTIRPYGRCVPSSPRA